MRSAWSYDELIKQVIVDGLEDLVDDSVCGQDLSVCICNCMDERAGVYFYFTESDAQRFIRENWEQNVDSEDIEYFLYMKILEGVDEKISGTSFVIKTDGDVLLTYEAVDEILKELGGKGVFHAKEF